jgi:hypothetical protein
MKKQLFLYLFIFSLVINVFIYMYYSGQEKYVNNRVEKMQVKLKKAQDSLKLNRAANDDADYFDLLNNDNAIDYFVDKGFNETDALAAKIKEGVTDMNQNPKGNALTGYDAINGQKFLINKVKILNNRWLIADFSNGKTWGDVLIKYFVDDKGVVTYETIQTSLYANTIE